jgi:sterol 3beta-glucosyltransferase
VDDADVRTPQENGVRNAIESIYRDMDYARSLTLKRRAGLTLNHKAGEDEAEIEKLSPNVQRLSQSLPRGMERPLTGSSDGSVTGAPSEDWSVISDPEDTVKRSSSDKKHQGRRRSLTSVVLSALPDSLTHLPTSPPR